MRRRRRPSLPRSQHTPLEPQHHPRPPSVLMHPAPWRRDPPRGPSPARNWRMLLEEHQAPKRTHPRGAPGRGGAGTRAWQPALQQPRRWPSWRQQLPSGGARGDGALTTSLRCSTLAVPNDPVEMAQHHTSLVQPHRADTRMPVACTSGSCSCDARRSRLCTLSQAPHPV